MRRPESASSERPSTTIRRANWSKDTETIRRLFQDYREWLGDHRDLAPSATSVVADGLASVDKQIAELPGPYRPPRGDVFLAFRQDEPVGCGALREFEPKVAEIKRVYVRADHRGPDFGRRLTRMMLARARELGYKRVRADTLPSMSAAIEYYQDMGFKPVPAYWPHPVRGALFFEYQVREPSSRQRQRRAPKSKRPSK